MPWVLVSCNDDEEPPAPEVTAINPSSAFPNTLIDVYVAGVEDNAQGVRVAKYWKNGVPVVLSDGSRPAFATAIDVIGDDVYFVGHEYNAANKIVVKL